MLNHIQSIKLRSVYPQDTKPLILVEIPWIFTKYIERNVSLLSIIHLVRRLTHLCPIPPICSNWLNYFRGLGLNLASMGMGGLREISFLFPDLRDERQQNKNKGAWRDFGKSQLKFLDWYTFFIRGYWIPRRLRSTCGSRVEVARKGRWPFDYLVFFRKSTESNQTTMKSHAVFCLMISLIG